MIDRRLLASQFSRAALSVVVAVAMSTLLLAIGRVAYGVHVPGAGLAGVALAVVVGAASFCCIGFAFSTRIGAADAAAPAANLAVLPLYFISGVFIPESQIPPFLRAVANAFPIRHLAQALLDPFVHSAGAGVAAGHLAIVATWGIAGLAVAARRFAWSPRTA